MAEPFATTADLEDHLGRSLTSAEMPRANAALRFASALVRAMAPWIDATPVPDGVSDVVAAMAARRVTARADGLKAAGPFVYADSRDGFTSDERMILLTALRLGAGSYTVSLAGPDL